MTIESAVEIHFIVVILLSILIHRILEFLSIVVFTLIHDKLGLFLSGALNGLTATCLNLLLLVRSRPLRDTHLLTWLETLALLLLIAGSFGYSSLSWYFQSWSCRSFPFNYALARFLIYLKCPCIFTSSGQHHLCGLFILLTDSFS